MLVKEFIENTVKTLDVRCLNLLRDKLIGEYLTVSFIPEDEISLEVFCEKLADYFEKVEIKTGGDFSKLLAKYVANLDEVVKRYMPKDPTEKKGVSTPPIPRSKKYYKYAVEIKGSRNLTMKQITDYSRIMMSLYMGVINAGMKEVTDYGFSTESLDLDKIISAMKAEKPGIGIPLGKKTLFSLEEPYSVDTATFVILMIMFSCIKNYEMEGED